MIAVTSLTPSSFVGRMLENQHIKFLGIISYSIYVWQELFLLPHWGLVGLVLLIPVSIGSYRFIERPGVRLGRRVQEWFERRDGVVAEIAVNPT
jgi:peptidoglycan/LPS O-acetylase OafA/YrhL